MGDKKNITFSMIFHQTARPSSCLPTSRLHFLQAPPAVSLVVLVCEYRTEAADVKQSHALDEKQAAAAAERVICYLFKIVTESEE